MWGWNCNDTSGKSNEGLQEGSSKPHPGSEKGGDAVPAPQPGRLRREEEEAGFRLDLALWEGAKHGLRGRSAAQTLQTVGAASPTHSSGHSNHKAGEHVDVGCSALGREVDLSWSFLPSRLVSSTLIHHQEERSSFLFIHFQ